MNRRSRRSLSRKEKQELIDGYRQRSAGVSKSDEDSKPAAPQRSEAETAKLMVPTPSIEVIPPDDLADARSNHRDAWGPGHVLERGKAAETRNTYHCQASGCDTQFVVDSAQVGAWGMEVDDE